MAAQKNAPSLDATTWLIILASVLLSALLAMAGIINLNGGLFVLAVIVGVGGVIWATIAGANAFNDYDSQWYCTRCAEIFIANKGAATNDAPRQGWLTRTLIETESAPSFTEGEANWSGPSPAVRGRTDRTFEEYADRVLNPRHRAGRFTPRDASGLKKILAHASPDGVFDPVALALDLGVASRLASLGYLEIHSPKSLRVTDNGKAVL